MFANTRSPKGLRVSVALYESQPTPATQPFNHVDKSLDPKENVFNLIKQVEIIFSYLSIDLVLTAEAVEQNLRQQSGAGFTSQASTVVPPP